MKLERATTTTLGYGGAALAGEVSVQRAAYLLFSSVWWRFDCPSTLSGFPRLLLSSHLISSSATLFWASDVNSPNRRGSLTAPPRPRCVCIKVQYCKPFIRYCKPSIGTVSTKPIPFLRTPHSPSLHLPRLTPSPQTRTREQNRRRAKSGLCCRTMTLGIHSRCTPLRRASLVWMRGYGRFEWGLVRGRLEAYEGDG